MINLDRGIDFFTEVDRLFDRPARIILVGETTQLFEGWQRWTIQLDFFCDVETADKAALNSAINEAVASIDIAVQVEFPGDIIPLPENYGERARDSTEDAWCRSMRIEFEHFDPYSVAYRFMARGSKTDYDVVLRFLEHQWINEPEMESRLENLLPKLTFETIQQDPAEFRRRYSGLQQMWRARQKKTDQSIIAG